MWNLPPADKNQGRIARALVQAFSEYDLDGNGRIEFGEFLRLFRSHFVDIEVIIPSLSLTKCSCTVTRVLTSIKLKFKKTLLAGCPSSACAPGWEPHALDLLLTHSPDILGQGIDPLSAPLILIHIALISVK